MTSVSSPYLLVSVSDSAYARRWRLRPECVYKMSADKFRIVFNKDLEREEGEHQPGCSSVVIGRGLIKWYCADERGCFYLELSSDCAFGPGAIQVQSIVNNGEMAVDIAKWVSKRFFPGRAEAALDCFAKGFSAAWRGIKDFLGEIWKTLCCCCCKPVEEDGKGSFAERTRIERLTRRKWSTRRRKSEFAKDIKLEGEPRTAEPNQELQAPTAVTADLPLSRDPVPERSSHLDIGRGMPSPQERSQSVQVRKRTSVKRKASHMWKSLSRNARLNHKDDSIDDGATNTYQSFENLDDCFHLDEDCDCSSHDQKRRHRDAKVEEIFGARSRRDWPQSYVAEDEGIATVSSESSPDDDDDHFWHPSSEDMTRNWYKQKTSCSETKDSAVPVAFDESDGMVIVVDAMDIYKVPRESLAEGQTKEEQQHQHRTSVQIFVNSGDSSSSDDFEKLGKSKEGDDDDETFVQVGSPEQNTVTKYIEHSSSLRSLKSSATVKSNIVKFGGGKK